MYFYVMFMFMLANKQKQTCKNIKKMANLADFAKVLSNLLIFNLARASLN